MRVATLARRHIHFDEVQHVFACVIAHPDDMVLFLETCTAEVSSDRTTQGLLPMECGPQGLRRPRFSFFRFSCQTAREPCDPPLRRTGEPPKPETPPKQDIRPKSAVWSPRWMRCFAGASSRRKAGGAPLWGLYSRGVTDLSTLQIADFDSNRACGERRFRSSSHGLRRDRAPHWRHIPPALFVPG